MTKGDNLMKFIRLLSVCTLSYSLPSYSQEVAVHAFEDMSCGAWSKSGQEPYVRAQYLWWIRGFVSGYNFGDPTNQIAVGRMPSNETVALYVDKFCREKPLNLFVDAAFDLVKELSPGPVPGPNGRKPSSKKGASK